MISVSEQDSLRTVGGLSSAYKPYAKEITAGRSSGEIQASWKQNAVHHWWRSTRAQGQLSASVGQSDAAIVTAMAYLVGDRPDAGD